MSDRDAIHTLTELQEARAEVDRLRDLLRWRKWPDEKPTENEANFLVVDKYGLFSVKYWCEDDVWLWRELLENGSYWRPIGPMSGEGGE